MRRESRTHGAKGDSRGTPGVRPIHDQHRNNTAAGVCVWLATCIIMFVSN